VLWFGLALAGVSDRVTVMNSACVMHVILPLFALLLRSEPFPPKYAVAAAAADDIKRSNCKTC
jgi:hypothetical protein